MPDEQGQYPNIFTSCTYKRAHYPDCDNDGVGCVQDGAIFACPIGNIGDGYVGIHPTMGWDPNGCNHVTLGGNNNGETGQYCECSVPVTYESTQIGKCIDSGNGFFCVGGQDEGLTCNVGLNF